MRSEFVTNFRKSRVDSIWRLTVVKYRSFWDLPIIVWKVLPTSHEPAKEQLEGQCEFRAEHSLYILVDNLDGTMKDE